MVLGVGAGWVPLHLAIVEDVRRPAGGRIAGEGEPECRVGRSRLGHVWERGWRHKVGILETGIRDRLCGDMLGHGRGLGG